jgi:hypothetical protein
MHGEVLQARIMSGSKRGDGIDVALRNADSRIIEWHRFNFPTIAAAIISFCRAKRIPLPYAGVKSLTLDKEGITFRIENRVSVAKYSDRQTDLSGQAVAIRERDTSRTPSSRPRRPRRSSNRLANIAPHSRGH